MKTVEGLKSRIALLESRNAENKNIVAKIKRQIRKIEAKRA